MGINKLNRREAARRLADTLSSIPFTSEKSSIDDIVGLLSDRIRLDDIPTYASSLAKGRGSGTEGDILCLPADHMEDWNDIPDEPDWRAFFVLHYHSDEEVYCYISLPELVIMFSIAFSIYADCDGVDWDPWPTIEGMQENCTRSAQLEMIPKDIREHYGI